MAGVIRFISAVSLAASRAVPSTRGVIRIRSSVFSIFSSVLPKSSPHRIVTVVLAESAPSMAGMVPLAV